MAGGVAVSAAWESPAYKQRVAARSAAAPRRAVVTIALFVATAARFDTAAGREGRGDKAGQSRPRGRFLSESRRFLSISGNVLRRKECKSMKSALCGA